MADTDPRVVSQALQDLDWKSVPVRNREALEQAVKLLGPAGDAPLVSNTQPAWTHVGDCLPEVEPDQFYGNEHAKAVLIRLVHEDGSGSCSRQAWKHTYRRTVGCMLICARATSRNAMPSAVLPAGGAAYEDRT